jgi:23S rRNA pseudouridine1911/1915/1917 synthase
MPLPIPPQKPFQLKTAPGQARLRIDRYLQQALPAISRHKVHELIEAGLVFVTAPGSSLPRLVKKSYKVGAEETIEIYFREQPPSDVKPEAIVLDIRYEDDDLLVVNKPAGMVTHPAHGHFSGTLVNALLHHLGMEDAGEHIRPGIVHRLDKGTSGLLVVAKNENIHRQLTEQFAARKVQRVYWAIVWGRFKKHEGEIDEPLGRHPGDRKRFAVVKRGGKTAITTYRVEETFRDTTLLTLRLKTGRTHQIRTHLEHEGHSVFGDATYGGRLKRIAGLPGARKKFYADLLDNLPEFALHAQTLGFVHPRTSEHLEFAAELPGNLSNILNLLRQETYKELDKMS